MRSDLLHDVLKRLDGDFAFKDRGDYLREGKCPQCSKKELWTRKDKPWVVRCGRMSKCGYERHVKDLYSDLFDKWSDRYKSTEKDPNAAADAYLHHARGFTLIGLRGLYTQENYFDPEIKQGTATVRFPLPGGGWWERLIDQPSRFGKKKARFAYGKSYAGHWWTPADDLAQADDIWLVEGIFDALSLRQHGLKAVALLSCNNYPREALATLQRATADLPKRPRLIWALDSDKAGTSYLKRWVKDARAAGWTCAAAQIPQDGARKVDWNDLHLRDRLGEKAIADYLWHGDVLLAGTQVEKALLLYDRHGWATFPFDFEGRMWWAKFDGSLISNKRSELIKSGMDPDEAQEQAIRDAADVVEIANCVPTALYYQANPVTDESWYYFRIDFPHDGASIKNTFTGGTLAGGAEFKKRLLSIAPGAVWTGSTGQLDRLMKVQLAKIKTVETIDFIGYSKEHRAYVLGDYAVKDGVVHTQNDEDFFDLGKLSLKSIGRSVSLDITPAGPEGLDTAWADLIWKCYGAKGFVALAFWFGSLFAEQIREAEKSFPFLEIVGDPGAGKSTLVEFLWKLMGRPDYEGFDPSKSTAAARARNFAQVANMPVVLIESDRGDDTAHAKKFDWDELKTAYNGRSVRSTGVKNGGNETREPPFRGAIVITQNFPVDASDAVLQRICHLHFTVKGHTRETKEAAQTLERTPVENVSGFLIEAVKAEAKVLATFRERYAYHEAEIQRSPDVKSQRLAKNHAQLCALVNALEHVIPLAPERVEATVDLIHEMAAERQRAINADHPLVQSFWELFDYLEDEAEGGGVDHAAKSELIAVSLPHFLSKLAARRLEAPPMADLKKVLATSKSRKFVDYRAVRSTIDQKTVKCWVFSRPGLKPGARP